ncbi:MAG: O-antigen ligase family protein [Nitrospira sp.]|nr:O-antigen ligase family protein [Nitrospira sp.]
MRKPVSFTSTDKLLVSTRAAVVEGYSATRNWGLKIYLLFAVSWFLHLGARLPLLGLLRFDLLLVVVLAYLAFVGKGEIATHITSTDKILRILISYSILTIPFVYWPGSVINTGIGNFIKAIVFYYFTVAFVRTEQDIKKLVFTFITCQVIRVLEPLYLHVTEGYWGGRAYMSGGAEALDRLSGAPSDVVNPNGLAFIICFVLPFLYLMAGLSWKGRMGAIVLAPVCLYALALTGSRSGIVGVFIIFLGILAKAKRRVMWMVSVVTILLVTFPLLSSDMQDRYLSVIGKGEKNAGTAEGRVTGVIDNFVAALHRPIFGHGLGTSQEVNANFIEVDMPAHNLYAEIAQELGFVGLALFIVLLKSIYVGFNECKRAYSQHDASPFLRQLVDSMQILLLMNFVFSFASYGLSSYEWYFLGGMSVSMQRLAMKAQDEGKASQGLNQ